MHLLLHVMAVIQVAAHSPAPETVSAVTVAPVIRCPLLRSHGQVAWAKPCQPSGIYHMARWIPDIWLWSARWRNMIRLRRHLRLTPRGREVRTQRLWIRTGQLSLGRAAISWSATSCSSFGKIVFFRIALSRRLSSAKSKAIFLLFTSLSIRQST